MEDQLTVGGLVGWYSTTDPLVIINIPRRLHEYHLLDHSQLVPVERACNTGTPQTYAHNDV